jgi:hypothetical protein
MIIRESWKDLDQSIKTSIHRLWCRLRRTWSTILTWRAKFQPSCKLAEKIRCLRCLLAVWTKTLKEQRKLGWTKLRMRQSIKRWRMLQKNRRKRSTRHRKTLTLMIQKSCLNHSPLTKHLQKLLFWSCMGPGNRLWIQATRQLENMLSFNKTQNKDILALLDSLALPRKMWRTNS